MRYWDIFTGSFHSANAYRTMRYTARGAGLGYSLVLVAVTTVLMVIYGTAMINEALFTSHQGKTPLFDDLVHQVEAQLPQMTIKDGSLSVEGPQPRLIYLTGRRLRGAVVTIDTTGATTYENMTTPVLITQKEIYSRSHEKTEIHSLSDFFKPGRPALILDHAKEHALAEQIIAFTHANLWKFFILIGIMLWLGFGAVLYVVRLFMLLFLALATLLLARFQKAPLDFAAAMRLAAMAYTPLAVIDIAVLALAATSLSRFLLFLFGVFLLSTVLRVTRAPGA